MAVSVPATFASFLKLEEGMKSMGFVEIFRREMGVIIKAHGLQPPREERRGEIGYKCSFHSYTVKVWTSCVRDAVEQCRGSALDVGNVIVSRPAGEDMGWVVIVDPRGQAQYFARPVLRTKNFMKTFLRRAWITQKKIKDRPLCTICGKFMGIHTTKSGGNFWGCYRRDLHPSGLGVTKDWDFNLPPKALKFAKAWRNQFARYLRAERKKGKNPQRASAVRTPWKATKNPF
jgi:hypothetical protein